jgi:ubiquinone/menaquinone biosynthesis C-methylase UbiE
MNRSAHWEQVYRTRRTDEVSWFQSQPARSLRFIQQVNPPPGGPVIDLGGGASSLVDALLDAGYHDVTMLDISSTALAHARARLGERSARVRWIEGDVLDADLPAAGFAVWHDRAVFHFLTTADDQARYVARVRHALRPGGHVVIATFAEDGPTRCSGLEVSRYSAPELLEVFGDTFTLITSEREEHRTPSGAIQRFTWCVLRLQAG